MLHNYKISEEELFILCNGLQLSYDREKYVIELDLEKCIKSLTYYGIGVHSVSKNEKNYNLQKKFNYFFSLGYMALLEINPEILIYQKLYKNSLSEKHSILAYASIGNQVKIIDSHMINDERGGLSVYNGEITFSEIEKGLRHAFFLDLSNYKLLDSSTLFNSLWKKYILMFIESNPIKNYIEDLNTRLHCEMDFCKLCSKIVFDNRFFSFLYILNYLKEYVNNVSLFNILMEDVEQLEQDINLTNYIFLKAAILKKCELYKKGVESLMCDYNMLIKLLKKLYNRLSES